jgi:hypothetical protein
MIAVKAGISEFTSDAITDHAPTTAGRSYTRAGFFTLGEDLKSITGRLVTRHLRLPLPPRLYDVMNRILAHCS